MRLQLQTWPEFDAYLRTSRGIIMPIGSSEQHGRIGLIGTDAICAEVIARGVGGAAGALVAPPIAVGMARRHVARPLAATETAAAGRLALGMTEMMLRLRQDHSAS